MSIFNAIMVGIGIVIGLIVLVVLVAFLIELAKAFIQLGKNDSDKQDINDGRHRQD